MSLSNVLSHITCLGIASQHIPKIVHHNAQGSDGQWIYEGEK